MNQKRNIALFVIAVITLILCLLIGIPVFLWIIAVSITRGKVKKEPARQNKLDTMISWCESVFQPHPNTTNPLLVLLDQLITGLESRINGGNKSQTTKTTYVDATVTKTTSSSSKTTTTMFDSFTSGVKSIFKWGLIIILARIIVGSAYFIVQPGQVAFLVRFGTIQPGNYTPGLYFKVPFIDKKVVMNTQIQKSEVTANSASSDLQDVSAQVALNYAVDTNSAKTLFQTVGTEEEVSSRLISPGIQEAVKAATAKYVASQLITDRVKVKSDMLTALKEKLEPRGIKIVDLNIVDFKFSEAFNQAVESKVRAEQDALAQKNKLEQVKYESQQQIEKSKAEAEKIKIQAEAITKQGGKEYVQLQRIAKRDGQLPKISSESNGMLLNVDSLSK